MVGETPDLSGVREKLARADDHIQEVKRRITPFAQAASDSIVRENDVKASKVSYRLPHDLPEPDPAWGPVIGDALFNMRSALDHLAWQLVILDGGQPCEHTYFPIHESRTHKSGKPRVLTIQPQIKSPLILEALDLVQPYQTVERQQSLWSDAFYLVNTLGNFDKHRLLLTAVHGIDFSNNRPSWAGDEVTAWWFNTEPLKGGDEVAWFELGGPFGAPEDLDAHVSLEISLGHGPRFEWAGDTAVGTFLSGLLWNIGWAITFRFSPLFGGPEALMA